MSDYSNIGLAANKIPANSPYMQRVDRMRGIDFDHQYDVQTKSLKGSRLFVAVLSKSSNVGTASGSFPTDSSVTVTSSFNLDTQYIFESDTFALPYLAIYASTAAISDLQIYPRFGAGVPNGVFSIASGYDLQNYNGENSVFRVNIENNTGLTQDLYAEAMWKYLDFRGENDLKSIGTS